MSNSPEKWEVLADDALASCRYDDALNEFDRLVASGTSSSERMQCWRHGRLLCLIELARIREARSALRDYCRHSGDSADEHLLIVAASAELELAAGSPRKTLKIIRRYETRGEGELEPSLQVKLLQLKVAALTELRRWPDVITTIGERKVVGVDIPMESWERFAEGSARFELGQIEEASSVLETVDTTELSEDQRANYHIYLGATRHAEGRLTEATQLFRVASESSRPDIAKVATQWLREVRSDN